MSGALGKASWIQSPRMPVALTATQAIFGCPADRRSHNRYASYGFMNSYSPIRSLSVQLEYMLGSDERSLSIETARRILSLALSKEEAHATERATNVDPGLVSRPIA